jgi:hypothetical protein
MTYELTFSARCPRCQREIDQGTFRRHALREFLDDGTLRFYCSSCVAEWLPSPRELANAERMLSQPVFYNSFV